MTKIGIQLPRTPLLVRSDIGLAFVVTQAQIVSDPLHMQRAMLLARDIGIRAHAAPTPTSRYRSWKSKGPSLAYETFFYLSYLATRSLGLRPQCAAG